MPRGGAAAAAVPCGGGEAAFRPIRADLDDMAAPLELANRGLRQPAFHDQHAWTRGARPKRARKMLRVPGRSVNRFLQIHPGMDVAQKELRRPLVLLIASGRTPRE